MLGSQIFSRYSIDDRLQTPLTWLANVMCSRPGSTWCTQPYNVLINDESIRRPGRLSTAEMTFGPARCVDGADGDVVSIIGRQRWRTTSGGFHVNWFTEHDSGGFGLLCWGRIHVLKVGIISGAACKITTVSQYTHVLLLVMSVGRIIFFSWSFFNSVTLISQRALRQKCQ